MKSSKAPFLAGLFALAWLVSQPALSAQRQARWSQITVAPLVIEAQPLEGAAPRTDADALSKQLADAAAQEAAKRLLQERIAATVETARRAPSVTFSGTIRLPLSLPPRVIGLRAHDREGVFATGHFTLRDEGGKVIAEETTSLEWNDVRWLVGGAKVRRNRALDEVLKDAVRKAVSRGVRKFAIKRFP